MGNGASAHSSRATKFNFMDDQILTKLEEIKQLSLLAAKNVLTFEDAVIITGMQKSYLYKLTCRHEIPFYRPNGKMLYFDRKELEEWMKRNRVQTRAEAEQQAINHLVAKELNN